MKINICFGNSNQPLNGYINTNIFEDQNFKNCHPENLDSIVDDGEAEQILAINVINYISYNNINDVIMGWFKKLKYDGTMTISFYDFLEICRTLTTQQLNMESAKKLIYGEQTEDFLFFKSGISLLEIKNIFSAINAKIEFCKRDGLVSYIKVRRIK